MFLGASSGSAELVYENVDGILNTFNASIREYGDEVRLAGSARTVTKFQFQYYGVFTADGDESMILRFYENDGPVVFERFPSPSRLIYESGAIPVSPGIHLVTISGLDVEVPSLFTWAVQFSGISNAPGDRAGLMFNANPTVGESFDDFWERQDDGSFLLYRFGANPVANYIARAYALPNPDVELVSIDQIGLSGYRMTVRGPIGESFWLEGSEDLIEWTRVQRFTMRAETHDQLVRNVPGVRARFFRIGMTDPEITDVQLASDGGVRLMLNGPSGFSYPLQHSADLVNWTDHGPIFFGDPVPELAIPTNPRIKQRFYRVLPQRQ